MDNYRNSATPPRVNDYVQIPGDPNVSRVLDIKSDGHLVLEMGPGEANILVHPQTVDL